MKDENKSGSIIPDIEKRFAIYNSDLPFPCYICNESFSTIFDLESHINLIHQELMIKGW